MAGAGLKAVFVHGVTCNLGYAVVLGRISMPDPPTTILHLLSVDHKRLTWQRTGLDQ